MPDEATPVASPAVETASPVPNSAPPPTEEAPKTKNDAPKTPVEELMSVADFENMTDSQINAIESGDPVKIAKALGLPETPAPTPAQAAPKAEDATPQGKTTEEPAGGDSPTRVSLKALKPEDRARTVRALDLIRSGTSPNDAFAEVFGITAPQAMAAAQAAMGEPAQPQTAPTTQPAPEVSITVAELEVKLAEKQKEYQEAKENYDPRATDILSEMHDIKLDLRDAKREAQVSAERQRVFEADVANSKERVFDTFASTITEQPKFLEYCDDEIALANYRNDPILQKPDWPEKIAQRTKAKYFGGTAANSAQTQNGAAQQTIPPAPNNSVRLPGSPIGPGFTAGSLSPQTALAEIDKLTPEQEAAFIQTLEKMSTAKR